MPRRFGRQEKQWVLGLHRIFFLDLAKQVGRVTELSFELLPHFFADLVAAVVNPGTDRSPKIARLGAEPAPHLAGAFFDDAPQRTAPPCMKRSYRTAHGINQQHGEAVGGLDSEQ